MFKNVASAEKMTIGDQSHESSALTKERQHGDSYEAVDLELTICQLGTPLKTSSIILSDDSHLHKLKGTAIDRLDSFSYPNEPNRFFDDSVDKNYLTNEKRRLEVSSIHISDDLQQSQVLDDSVFGSSSITLLKLEKSWNLNETSHGVPFSFTDELAFPVKVETSSENTYGVVKPSLSPFDDDFSQTAPVPNKDTSIWSANLTKAKLISLPTTEDQKRPRGKSFDETIFSKFPIILDFILVLAS